ncbi:biotin/lipoyl-containing protein, partial [Oleiphilus sp. HI0067]
PDVGTEDAVEVIELLVNVGDSIAIDDPIIVLESDKASIEVPATSAGVIDAIKVKVGDQVKQGDTLISVSAESSDEPESGEQKEDVKEKPIAEIQEAAPEQNVPKAVSESTTTEVIVPDLGGADEVEVIELCAGVGTNLNADDAIIVLESDKASMDIPCPVAGEILDFKVSLSDKVKEGDVIALIKTQA